MADDARLDELRGLMAEALDSVAEDCDPPLTWGDRDQIQSRLLPVVSAWAEQHAARRAAEAWDKGYAAGDRDAYEAAQILEWNFRRMGDDECTPNPYRAALTPATEEER